MSPTPEQEARQHIDVALEAAGWVIQDRPALQLAAGPGVAGHGFAISDWQALAAALRHHAAEHPVVEAVETVFGVRYVVDGILHTPDGRTPKVRVVWFIDRADEVPRLVTAFPAKRREEHDPGT